MKPFLKWAGGKTQLIAEIERNLPQLVFSRKFTYVEPFAGSGAVLFWLIKEFPNMEKAVINDINFDLINTYSTIKSRPKDLISILKGFQNEYHNLLNADQKKKEYYYQKRDLYNTRNTDKIMQAALFIFLNRTCFNGLYRVNRSNLFNVPMGSYKLPTICDEQNILAVSNTLQNVEILNSDFEKTLPYASENSFFYLDPPYKPLSVTSSFNSYAKNEFDDNEQIRLKDFCVDLHARGSKWLLSNSDVQQDDFFHRIYESFNIKQVKAKRVINSKPEKRGKLDELLITNYKLNEFHLAGNTQQKLWNEQTRLNG
ncbi:MAG: DNA adenine methylase [Acidobacteriota bacterium]|nr:DNA adenine methylase [Acidobacteriota bacterium]